MLAALFAKTLTASEWPKIAFQDADGEELPHCPIPGPSVECCGHLGLAPRPMPGVYYESPAKYLATSLCWVTSHAAQCCAAQAWFGDKVTQIQRAIDGCWQTWADTDLFKRRYALEPEPGMKRRRRFDVHVREHMCSQRATSSYMPAAAAVRATHEIHDERLCERQERLWLQEFKAAQWMEQMNSDGVGCSFDAATFGNPKKTSTLALSGSHIPSVGA